MHVYRQGYSVLPALQKLNKSPFEKNRYLIRTRQEASKIQKVFFEHDISQEIYVPICEYISRETNQKNNSFQNLAYNLAEDVIIHRIQGDKDWLAAGHICLPSQWWPEEKIGKPLAEIHAPVPGMKNNHFKLVETMINAGPFLRYVWSIIFEDRINFHPSIPKKEFDFASSAIYIKVEEQMTIGFPEIKAALFVLRQNLILPGEIDYPSLYKTCKNMTPEQKKYKNVTEELIQCLEKITYL